MSYKHHQMALEYHSRRSAAEPALGGASVNAFLQEMVSRKGRGRRMKDGRCHCTFHWKQVSSYLIISLSLAYVDHRGVQMAKLDPSTTTCSMPRPGCFRRPSNGAKASRDIYTSHDNHGPRRRIVLQLVKRPPGTATLLAYIDVADGELVCAAARFTEDRDPAESGASAGMCQCVYQDEGGLERGRAQRECGHWRRLRSLPAAAVAF